jgi:biopolymer transport protein ExbB
MARSAVLSPSRLIVLFLACLFVFFVAGSVTDLAPTAHAQDATPDDAQPTRAEKKSPGLFRHILESVGWFFGLVLLGVSIALVALIVLLSMELRLGAAIPPMFVEEFTETVNKRRFKEAYEMAKEDGSFLGRVLTTGMSRLQYGIEDAREASYNMVESIKAGKEQLVTYLATIGTLGPMLGLVGTVWGMILAFMELASQDTVKAQGLASAISHALVVTLLGIGLSVPAIFCHALFRNRLIKLAHDTGNVADDLLTQMYHNSKKAPTATPTPVEAAPEARATGTGSIKQR